MPVASISGSVTAFVLDHGLYAVFVLMLVDSVFPAFSELVMVVGGALAAGAFAGHDVSIGGHGVDAYVAIALAGTIGYLIGSWLGWGIGRYGGRRLIERRGRWLHLDAARLDRAEAWFRRWEDWGVLLGRVTPVIRSFVSIPAGIFGVRFWRYTWLTLLGSAIWAFAFAGIGYGLGSSYERFHRDFRFADYLVALAVVAAAAFLVMRWRRASTLRRRGSDPAR